MWFIKEKRKINITKDLKTLKKYINEYNEKNFPYLCNVEYDHQSKLYMFETFNVFWIDDRMRVYTNNQDDWKEFIDIIYQYIPELKISQRINKLKKI